MISVCMAAYKGEKYIQEQVESILQNLSPNDELIVSDDAKDNNLASYLERISEKTGIKIHFLEGPQQGVVENFEHAMERARGDVIFLADQDDVWMPDKVEKVMKHFENPNCMMVVHDAGLIDENGKDLGTNMFDIRNSGPGMLKNIWKNSFVGCCMAFRKEVRDKALPIPDRGMLHDQWLGLQAHKIGQVEFEKERLIQYRRHENNVSQMTHLPVHKMIYNRLYLCWKLLVG